jgi:glyoxylate/hydroxypyruvate reductase
MSVGVDHVDVPAVTARGIKLGFTPDVLTDAVAELTVALLLATSRRLFEAHQQILKYVDGLFYYVELKFII